MLNFANVFVRSTVTGLMVSSGTVSNVVNSQTAPNRPLTDKVHNVKVASRLQQKGGDIKPAIEPIREHVPNYALGANHAEHLKENCRAGEQN